MDMVEEMVATVAREVLGTTTAAHGDTEIDAAKVEPTLIQPTSLLDSPLELSPLAKRKPDNPRLVERFELFIASREVGNAYSELNDPLEQRERMLRQARLRAAGEDEEALAEEVFL